MTGRKEVEVSWKVVRMRRDGRLYLYEISHGMTFSQGRKKTLCQWERGFTPTPMHGLREVHHDVAIVRIHSPNQCATVV